MLAIGDTVKLKADSGIRRPTVDRCRYDGPSVQRGGRNVHYHFTVLEGDHKGRSFKLAMPYNTNIIDYVQKVRKSAGDDAAAQEARAAKIALESKAYDALRDVEAGDLVTVTIQTSMGPSTYDFKVFEVDYTRNRLKGYKPDTDPGSKKGWINAAHKDVSFVIKTKKFFDARTDSQAQVHARRAADAAEKRSATRQRNRDLRSIFGE